MLLDRIKKIKDKQLQIYPNRNKQLGNIINKKIKKIKMIEINLNKKPYFFSLIFFFIL